MITETDIYNSLHFQGGSWMEIARMDSMKMGANANEYTLQFWVSGGEVDTNDAPAFFSLIDPQDNIKLALFRDRGNPSTITSIVNSINFVNTPNELDWSDPDEFYLISILFSDTQGLMGYVNEIIFLPKTNDPVIIGDSKLMIGTKANEERTILENFWYGYIDEIRLWNTWLSDSTIQFQSEHPDKLGDYYLHTYHDSLIGLWRFNLLDPTATIIDESENGHHGTIYTLPNYSIELSEKGAQ